MERRRHAAPRLLALAAVALTVAAVFALRVPAAPAAEGGPAEAFPVDGPALALARGLADAHWGATPCRGDVALAWTPLAPGTNATASWRNPTDAWDDAEANFDCRIDLNPGAEFDWPKLCSVVVHEMGHLLGHPHVEDPADVMAAFYLRPLPVCERHEEPTATLAAQGPAPGRPRQERRMRAGRAAARRAMRCRVARRMLGARRAARSRLRCRLPRSLRRGFVLR